MTLEQFEVFQIFANDFKRSLGQFRDGQDDMYVKDMFADLIDQVDNHVELIGEAVEGSIYAS